MRCLEEGREEVECEGSEEESTDVGEGLEEGGEEVYGAGGL